MHSIFEKYRGQMSTKFDSLNRQKTENDWLLFAASFMVKFELVFVLTQKYFF